MRLIFLTSVMGDFTMSISEKVQLTYTTILEHFVSTGHAPHYTELAEMLDIGIDEARELQREAASTERMGCWMSHDTDYIESWAPFSNVPTHHLISVDGKPGWYGQ
jgi:hypothetical protein